MDCSVLSITFDDQFHTVRLSNDAQSLPMYLMILLCQNHGTIGLDHSSICYMTVFPSRFDNT